ncbi:MAG: hypothetical protein KDD64_06700 [Bdellovibrionales bacterium]|nr:hypothetical protein [Bdellovibrionales bacterium]
MTLIVCGVVILIASMGTLVVRCACGWCARLSYETGGEYAPFPSARLNRWEITGLLSGLALLSAGGLHLFAVL